MNEVVRITVRLTVSCMIAAAVMGTVFVFTDPLKRDNERLHERRVMLELLGYDDRNPPPDGLELRAVYRYVLGAEQDRRLGYVVPLREGAEHPFALVVMDLDGAFAGRYGLDVPAGKLAGANDRDAALRAVLPAGTPLEYAERSIVVERDGRREAFLLPGRFTGYKTFIRIMLALDAEFTVIGFRVLEHEEDPGLGAEIEKDYFRHQFRDKGLAQLKDLKVIKVPLSDAYRAYLIDRVDPAADRTALRAKYRDQDIHALTGATISSEAVTNGIRAMARKFAYRLRVLDRVIREQEIPAGIGR